MLLREPEVLPHRGVSQPSVDPEGPAEGPAACGQVEARETRVEIGSPARLTDPGIRDDGQAVVRTAGDHTQQLLLRGPLTTTHAGAHRNVCTGVDLVFANHHVRV